jgi:LPS export ABC transporter protein LptC
MMYHPVRRISNNIYNVAIAFVAIVLLFYFSSCSGDKNEFGKAITSRDSTSMMTTRGITSLISENGIIKYKITAEEWEWFDQFKPPYQAFEKGIYLEVYDSTLEVVSSIYADTAYYYMEKELWELRGDVHAENESREKFDTQLLFWNQRYERVYSDTTIKIEQEDQMIIGKGFQSNQDFSVYSIIKTKGVFPIKE